jgi:uncharacterized sulfatase
MLDLAGVKTPSYMQGRSFTAGLQGRAKPDDWPDATYYRYWMHMAHAHNNPAHFGIRTQQYKLIFFYGCDFTDIHNSKPVTRYGGNRYYPDTPAAWEFYDLTQDPHEMHNRYKDPAYRSVIATLKEQLKTLRADLDETDKDYPRIQAIIDAHWND